MLRALLELDWVEELWGMMFKITWTTRNQKNDSQNQLLLLLGLVCIKFVIYDTETNYYDEPLDSSRKSQVDMDQMIKRQIPHSYMYGSANISSLLSFLNNVSTTANVTLSSTDVAVKAITNALLRESLVKSVHVNVCLGVAYNVSKCFTIPGMNVGDYISW